MGPSRFFDYGTDPAGTGEAPAFLHAASVDDWAAVVSHCERRRFRAGDVVLHAGEADRSLLIIIEGELQAIVDNRDRKRRFPPVPAGSVVGEIGFLDGLPRSASVVATTDGELLRMSLASFETLAATNPRLGRLFLFDLGCILAQRVRTLTNDLMDS